MSYNQFINESKKECDYCGKKLKAFFVKDGNHSFCNKTCKNDHKEDNKKIKNMNLENEKNK